MNLRSSTDNRDFDFALEHDAFGRLVLVRADGARHVGVEPVRAFPISDPEHTIALRDAEGRELFLIDDLARLPEALRRVLTSALAQRDFMPQIRRIIGISLQTDPCEWDVETDRGPTKFVLKSEENVRRLDKHRALVIDANGIRYLIADTKQLDKQSRRLLERYL